MSASLLGGETGLGLVLVEFEFAYQGRDGTQISIKPNERYILLDKTNDHWWQVRKDQHHKPFYIPAKYVKELPTSLPSLLDFTHLPAPSTPLLPPPNTTPKPIPVPVPKTSEELAAGRTKPGDEVTIRLRPDSANHRRMENRMSTFGVLLDVNEPLPSRWGADMLLDLPGDSGEKTSSEGATNMINSSLWRKSQSVSGTISKSLSQDDQGGATDPIASHRPHTQLIPVETPTVPSIGASTKQADHPSASSQRRESYEEEENKEEENMAEEEYSEEEEDSYQEEDSNHIYESIQDLGLDSLRIPETPHSQIPKVQSTLQSINTGKTVGPDGVPEQVLQGCADQLAEAQNAANVDLPVYANASILKKMATSLVSVSTISPSTDSTNSLQDPTHSSLGHALSSSLSSSGMLGPASPLSSQDGWQVHTDKDSGKAFYYHPNSGETTWFDPRSPSSVDNIAQGKMGLQASPSPLLSPASSQGFCGWEQLLDETSGIPYYYNSRSGATSWDSPEPLSPNSTAANNFGPRKPDGKPPPLPKEDYPMEEENSAHVSKDPEPQYSQQGEDTSLIPRVQLDSSIPSTPAGWTCAKDADGKTVYTSLHSQEQWILCEDDRGKIYFYLRDGTKSQWTLPKLSSTPGSQQPQRLMDNGVDQEEITMQVRGRRQAMSPPLDDKPTDGEREGERCDVSHRRGGSDYSDTSISGTVNHTPPPSHLLEKVGILNKTKVVDNGKRIRKNWSQSWTVLHGGVLTFHKDPKTAPSSTSGKNTQIVPEYTVDLRGASLSWAAKDKSSKKNVLELKTRHGCEYLVQYDTESIICDWQKVILETIRQLDHDLSEESDDGQSDREDREKKRNSTRSISGSADPDQGRVRNKLRKFLQRRPTLQSVKDKGYIRDNVFGCHLDTLCHRENTTVPKFVEKCIRSVERRGLDVDGIYRVSGNLAVIQKLRHKADHEEELDLEDGQWDEIHVITGALKLFFRELPEPLFPFDAFTKFITAIKISDYSQRVSYIKDLVHLLPLPNHDTMEVLFRHLRKVTEHGESNRMSVQSVAIVFGPTLLRPQTESANFTVHMIFQSQIVELVLNEFHTIFPGV